MNKTLFVALALGVMIALVAHGRDWYVDPRIGDDSASGLGPKVAEGNGPVKTIARGIALAQPGDTVHLAPTVYRDKGEQVGIYDKSGEPGKPITIDGHGAVIDGVAKLDPSEWTRVSPGLYKNSTIFKKHVNNEDAMSIFAFVFDGVINRMGRTQKGAVSNWAWKAPADLQPGEWTYQKAENHALYIKIDPARTLADENIDVPIVNSACQISGAVSHIVIKNLTTKHCWNDGFALTTGNKPNSKVRDITYENIRAIDIGDDGFSAHGDCEVTVDGYTAIGCGTGFCTGGSGTYRRVVIMNTFGMAVNFYEGGDGKHVLTDSLIAVDGHSFAYFTQSSPGQRVDVTMRNCVLVVKPGCGATPFLRVYDTTSLTCENCTIFNQGPVLGKASALTLNHCVLAGGPDYSMNLPTPANWHADHNAYDLGSIIVGSVYYYPKTVETYKAASAQDANSSWQSLTVEQVFDPSKRPPWLAPDIGADLSKIPAIPGGKISLLECATEVCRPLKAKAPTHP